MVMGIVGLIFSFVPCLGMYALPVTGIAIILGALALRAPKDGSPHKGKGMAIAGLVCGLIGSLIAAYWLWAWMHVKDGNGFGGFNKEFKKGFDEGIEKALKEQSEKAHKDLNETAPDPTPVPAEKPDDKAPTP